ncbi:yhdW [Symbiodinium microadriaticum]|nr:yhdW [Symbiodinium microadriaticum]
MAEARDYSWLTTHAFAHRGLHDRGRGIIENSPSAFAAAINGGYGIELDVQLTSDGEALVFHDRALKRLTGETGKVPEMTAAALTALTLTDSNDHPPLLSETLAQVDGAVPILVELKTRPGEDAGGLEERVAELLKTYQGPVSVMSFSPESVGWFADNAPDIPRGQIAMNYFKVQAQMPEQMRSDLTLLRRNHISRPHFIAYDINSLPQPAVAAERAKGLPVLTWTVRNGQQWAKAYQNADAIKEVGEEAWDRCNRDEAGRAYSPFTRYAFLAALEGSGSADWQTGWGPRHLVLEDDAGTIQGVAPMYLKTHSQGEYVFDHSWAHALERAGGDYYPKLQICVPFTPATGPRLLVDGSNPDKAALQSHLIAGASEFARRMELSSVHMTFATKPEWDIAGKLGLLQRTDQQFHWLNDGYETFDDFLAALSSRKRKQIKRERRDALKDNGISIDILNGDDLTEEHWDAFYHFYMDTGARKWGRPYLTRTFFSQIGETMAEDIVLILARRDGRYIAGAINFKSHDTLFGRHWGAVEHHPFLHFEICYYQAIQYAIDHGLSRVEAGAQGAHKLARGYMPSLTYSAHWIGHEGFRAAVDEFLKRERDMVQEDQSYLAAHAPFRKDHYDFTSEEQAEAADF